MVLLIQRMTVQIVSFLQITFRKLILNESRNNINKNISAVIELLEKELPEEELNKLTAEDIVNIMVDISRERIKKRNNNNSNSDNRNS